MVPDLPRSHTRGLGWRNTWASAQAGFPLAEEAEAREDTAVVGRPSLGWRLLGRFESLRAWGFVGVATLTFAIVYAVMYGWASPPAAPKAVPEIQVRPPARAAAPLVVPTSPLPGAAASVTRQKQQLLLPRGP
jgi:hypothetical protein